MAVTAYCTQTEIDAIFSTFGVVARLDDDLDGSAEVSISSIIEQASTRLNMYLMSRYSASVIAASAWAKWACAAFAAQILARRRGNEVPASFEAEVQGYEEWLKDIKAGRTDLMADDGPATPVWDETPAVSNLAIDGRFTRQKVRRVSTSSTGGPQTNNGRMQNNLIDYTPLWT